MAPASTDKKIREMQEVDMQSVNLTTAFVITQFFLLIIVFSGIVLLSMGEKNLSTFSLRPRQMTRRYPFLFAGFALVTIGLLIFSEDVMSYSRPVFGDVQLPSITRNNAFLLVFSTDILGAANLIFLTGGAKDSPFSAILLTLPALAIFLREPPERLLGYAVTTALLFLCLRSDASERTRRGNPHQRIAYTLVTLGCLGLSTLVGYATRPQ
jgi:hypothetical protein